MNNGKERNAHIQIKFTWFSFTNKILFGLYIKKRHLSKQQLDFIFKNGDRAIASILAGISVFVLFTILTSLQNVCNH